MNILLLIESSSMDPRLDVKLLRFVQNIVCTGQCAVHALMLLFVQIVVWHQEQRRQVLHRLPHQQLSQLSQFEPVAVHPLDPEPETDEFVGVETTDLPFSAGIPPEAEPAMIGKVAFVLDEAFVETSRSRNMKRRTSSLSGRDMLYEYACSDTSIIGERLADIGIRCTRLTRGGIRTMLHRLSCSCRAHQVQMFG